MAPARGFSTLLLALALCACEPGEPPPQKNEPANPPTNTHWKTGAQNAPGVLLIHPTVDAATHWAAFAQPAAARGYHSLAVGLDPHAQDASLTRLHQAYAELLHLGADPQRISIVASGAAATLAARYAADGPTLAAFVLISPSGINERESFERDIHALRQTPLFVAAAVDDSRSVQITRTIQPIHGGFCEVREYPGAFRGVDLLAASEALREQLHLWMEIANGTLDAPPNPR